MAYPEKVTYNTKYNLRPIVEPDGQFSAEDANHLKEKVNKNALFHDVHDNLAALQAAFPNPPVGAFAYLRDGSCYRCVNVGWTTESGGSGSEGTSYFYGYHLSFDALKAAHPKGKPGARAIIRVQNGNDLEALWDEDDQKWFVFQFSSGTGGDTATEFLSITTNWMNGLTYNPYAEWKHNGMKVTDSRSLTADPADPTYDRYDLFIINLTTSRIEILKGVASENRIKPELTDPINQLDTGIFIDIPAGATAPVGVSGEVVYAENAPGEYAITAPGSVNPASIKTPHSGAVNIEVVDGQFLVQNQAIVFTPPAPLTTADNELSYWQKNKAAGAHHWTFVGTLAKNGRTGSVVVSSPGNYNPNTADWQALSIPFPAELSEVTSFRLVADFTGFSFHLDDIKVISGGGTVVIGGNYADKRLSNIASDLSEAEKTAIKNKLGVVEGGGGTGSGVTKRYLTWTALLADQATQVDLGVYYVSDASGHSTVDSGFAYFEYLGTTNGTESDYRKLSEEESMDVDPTSGGSTALRVFNTSESGAISDADISLGSYDFGTDSTAALQALLDEALNGPIYIVWDGRYSISQTLKIHSNTIIYALSNCGWILRDHSSVHGMANANLVDPSSVGGWGSNIVDKNILIENLIMNGNGYNEGPTGSDVFDPDRGSTVNGSAQMKRICIGWFKGIRNFKLKNIQFLGGRYWAVHFVNIQDAVFEDLLIDFGQSSTRDGYNYDGYNFGGGCNNIRGRNWIIRNGCDDNIALNAHAHGWPQYEPENGPITNIQIENVYLDSRSMGIGIYSEIAEHPVDKISIRGIKGRSNAPIVRISNGERVDGSEEGPGAMGSILLEDIDVIQKLPDHNLVDFGGLIYARGKVKSLTIKNISRNEFGDPNPLFAITDAQDSYIQQLTIDGVQQVSSGGTWNKAICEIKAGTVERMILKNVQQTEETSISLGIDSAPILVNGGIVKELNISDIQAKNIRNILKHTSGTVEKIVANNIIHTGNGVVGFSTFVGVPVIHLSNYEGETPLYGIFTRRLGSSLTTPGEFYTYTLPDAAMYQGAIISVINDPDGYIKAFSNGVDWVKLTNGVNVIPTEPPVNGIFAENFDGTTVDASKGTVTNPDSANLSITQNGKLYFTRVTDVNILHLNNGWNSTQRFSKGHAISVLMKHEVGFLNDVFAFRWMWDASNYISMQGTGGTTGRIRTAVMKNGSLAYDLNSNISGSNRVKIYYNEANNEIKFFYWNGTAWGQIGTTAVVDLGAGDGLVNLASSSFSSDAPGDQFSFDELVVNVGDYLTERP